MYHGLRLAHEHRHIVLSDSGRVWVYRETSFQILDPYEALDRRMTDKELKHLTAAMDAPRFPAPPSSVRRAASVRQQKPSELSNVGQVSHQCITRCFRFPYRTLCVDLFPPAAADIAEYEHARISMHRCYAT